MQLYQIDERGLTPLPYDPADWPPHGRACWLDGVPEDPDLLLPIFAPLEPHPLLLADLLGPNRTTLLTRYDDTVYMEFPVTAAAPVRGVPYVAMLIAPDLLITVPHGPTPDLEAYAARLNDRPALAPTRLDSLIIAILGFLVDAAKQEALLLRDEVYAVSDQLDEDVDSVELEQIATLRRRLRGLSIVAEDQHYCIVNLHPNAAHLWQDYDEQKLFLRDLVNDTEYVMRTAQRLEQRLEGLHDQYQLALHDRTEARLRVLTIISVIMLPLTLITGFFGMNFPDLYLTGVPYGQELVLLLLLLLPAILLWVMQRRGWFD